MWKLSVTLLALGATLTAWGGVSKKNTLLECLGQEETSIHRKKMGGPLYFLNQELISTFSTYSQLHLTAEARHEICANDEFSPSLKFVEMFLLEGESIFQLPDENTKRVQHKNVIGELMIDTIGLFFQYVSHLQGITPHKDCLAREIPELSGLWAQYQHLSDEAKYDFFRQNAMEVRAFFDKIHRFDVIYEKCEELKRKETQKKKTGKLSPHGGKKDYRKFGG